MAVYYNDSDPAACAWLRDLIAAGHLPAGEVDERSILDVEPSDLRGFAQCHFFAGIGGWPYALRLAGVAEDRPVWTGSPPCQPFSQAGKRKGQDDDRHLAPAFLRLVAACRPELVFGEQVASAAVLGPSGRTVGTTAEGAAGWAWFDALAADLEAASYAVAAADLPAAGIGAPHRRAETTDPSKTRKPPAPKLKPVPEAAVTAVGDTLREQGLSVPAVGGGGTFLQAKTANEVLKAQERRIRLSRLKGELIERARALALVFRLAREERDAWVTWPARAAALMAAELSASCRDATGQQITVEPAAMQKVLERHVRAHLDELAEVRPDFR